MNKGQHNTFKKLSPDFFSIEITPAFIVDDTEQRYNIFIN